MPLMPAGPALTKVGAACCGPDGIWRDDAGREVRVWLRFLSGRRLNLADPSPLDFESEDIALGLSRQNRWSGQTEGEHPYTVAQHSLFVLEILRRGRRNGLSTSLALAALLHDASEGLGANDVLAPLKAVLGAPYGAVEETLQRCVHIKFGLPPVLPVSWKAAIKHADRVSAATEAMHLAGFTEDQVRRVLKNPHRILPLAPPWRAWIEPWPPAEARRRFGEALQRLEAQRRKEAPAA